VKPKRFITARQREPPYRTDSKTKIQWIVGAAVLLGDDVLNVETSKWHYILVYAAVFASVACPFTN